MNYIAQLCETQTKWVKLLFNIDPLSLSHDLNRADPVLKSNKIPCLIFSNAWPPELNDCFAFMY